MLVRCERALCEARTASAGVMLLAVALETACELFAAVMPEVEIDG